MVYLFAETDMRYSYYRNACNIRTSYDRCITELTIT